MKMVRKFWGIVIIVILLCSMFIGAAAPVSAANYAFSPDLTQPTVAGGGLAAMSILDVAQSGSTMYATTSIGFLYKSLNGGTTWFPVNFTLAGTPGIIAVAPDDANIVAYVNTAPAADLAYLSTNGGVTFGMLLAPGAALAIINGMSISPLTTDHYIAIGGSDAAATASRVAYWPIGFVAPVWTSLATPPTGIDSTKALAFSSNFAADACLLVTGIDDSSAARGLFVDVFSFNLLAWNPAGYGFPRTVVATAATDIVCARAQIVLDQNFYVGDVTTQVGFIAADITNAGVQAGGIFRMDMTKITSSAPSVAFNSVAWDGSNLMAGVRTPVGPVTVLRCSNALAVAGWAFIPNSWLVIPGTGTLPLVMFNGGKGYCFSSGPNNAVARTTDLGKTFQGTALVNSNFNLITDYWVSPDGAVTYVLADDGMDINLWKKSGATWIRTAILAGATGQAWMVRADKDDPNTVYMGRQGNTIFQKSVDGGVNWVARAASANIQDFVVQDANTVYVATVGAPARVVKSINGAFSWTPTFITFLAGTCYSLNLIADNQLIVGSTAGSVAYTTDVVTWTTIPAFIGTAPVIATASGLAAGNVIWAGGLGGNLGMWTIGTNTAFTGWTPYLGSAFTGNPIATVNGIAYANNILYVLDNTAGIAPFPPFPPTVPSVYRFLYPTITIAFPTEVVATGLNVVAGTTINALQYTTGSTNLVVRASAGTDTMQSYTDRIVDASVVPVPTYPVNGAIIDVNHITGGVDAFNFMWTAPFAESPSGYNFDLQVFMDELGTVPASALAVGVSPVFFDGGTGSYLSTNPAFAFAPVPDETYYWRIRVSAGNPVQSFWSPMQSFSIGYPQGYPQAWYLNDDLIMYRGEYFKPESSVLLLDGEHYLWLSNETAVGNVVFPADAWTCFIKTSETLALGEQIGVTLGTWNGSVFTPVPNGSETVTSDGFSTFFILSISANSFAVMNGEYLALELENPSGGTTGDFYIITGGINSFVLSPDSDPGYPLPEMSAVVLLGLGLAGLTAFYIIKRKKNTPAVKLD